MGVEQLNIPPLQMTDPSLIQKTLSNINPQAILADFGFNTHETAEILEGDMGPVTKHLLQKLRSLDFNKIMTNYCKDLSPVLCHLFFEKAIAEEQFTEEEVRLYKETYEKFFLKCFEVGTAYIYRYEEVPDVRNLLIKVNEEFFQLSQLENKAVILHLPDYNP
jgi:hypothetical protein